MSGKRIVFGFCIIAAEMWGRNFWNEGCQRSIIFTTELKAFPLSEKRDPHLSRHSAKSQPETSVTEKIRAIIRRPALPLREANIVHNQAK